MSRSLTAQDQAILRRVVASLPAGAPGRAILAGLGSATKQGEKSAANRGSDSAWGGGDRQKMMDEARRDHERAAYDQDNPEFASYQDYRKLNAPMSRGEGLGAVLHPHKSEWASIIIEEADSEDLYERFGDAKVRLDSFIFKVPGADLFYGSKIKSARVSPVGHIVVPNVNYDDILGELLSLYERFEMSGYDENHDQSSMEAFISGEIKISPSDLKKKVVPVKCNLTLTGYAEADNSRGSTRRVRFGTEIEVDAKFHKSKEFEKLIKGGAGLFAPISDPHAKAREEHERYVEVLEEEDEKRREKAKPKPSSGPSGLDLAALDDAARYQDLAGAAAYGRRG